MTEKINETYCPVCINGLSQIVECYDAFLIDQWGVLHNGQRVYDGVMEVLYELKSAGKPVLILTNSAKTREANVERLDARFAISDELYTDIVSSAQVLRDLLEFRSGEPWSTLGRRVFMIADQTDDVLLTGTSLERVELIQNADFAMLLSVMPGETKNEHQDWINWAAKSGMLVVCPSADLLSVSISGVVSGLASIVRDLLAKGGRVLNVGKPERPVYDICRNRLHGISANRILAIGDQIDSDCIGANRQGMDSALVCTGATLDTFPGSGNSSEVAEAISKTRHEPVPQWILPSLLW